MPIPNQTLSNLVGTMRALFRFGALAALKASSGLLTVRNSADTADADIAAKRHQINGTTSGSIGLKAPAAVTTYDLTLPAATGGAGTALVCDGSGNLSWQVVATGATQAKAEQEVIGFGSASPVTIFTFPTNAQIVKVTIDVETAFNATGPSMSVGVAGDTARYFGATDVDLATVGLYEVSCAVEETTSAAVIVTFGAGTGGTTGSARVTVHYVNPG